MVLSNRLEADFAGSLLDAYRVLRTTNPSPYMFYFSSDDIEMVGASPETLVKLEDGVLHTFPLAGTRKRGKTEQEDLELEKELLADEKERAEHNMLVDLGRNDIGKISDFGTVEVEKYMTVERFRACDGYQAQRLGLAGSDRTRQHWMPLMRFFRQEHCPRHRSFGPVRLLMIWKIISVVFTVGPSVIWTSQAIWIPVLRFVWHFRKRKSICRSNGRYCG